ncbi:hypothetical protein MCAV_02590 [[Mycoplasma] cavipharyngis]|uniref:hypothetical protein n=1 Tax=[Mycoplasma] cavipharyngis TaxID=92757 RepID=UPI003703FDA0
MILGLKHLNNEQKSIIYAGANAQTVVRSIAKLAKMTSSTKIKPIVKKPTIKLKTAAIRTRGRPKKNANNKIVAKTTKKATKILENINGAEITNASHEQSLVVNQSQIQEQLNEKNQSGFWKRTFNNAKAKLVEFLDNKDSQATKTFGISNSRLYQLGIWPLAVVSSFAGLTSNIQTANEILNEPPTKRQIYQDKNGIYRELRSDHYDGVYSQSQRRQDRYAINASRMQPFIRVNADPRKSTITFGAPFFF